MLQQQTEGVPAPLGPARAAIAHQVFADCLQLRKANPIDHFLAAPLTLDQRGIDQQRQMVKLGGRCHSCRLLYLPNGQAGVTGLNENAKQAESLLATKRGQALGHQDIGFRDIKRHI
jgi:hypothetical protein